MASRNASNNAHDVTSSSQSPLQDSIDSCNEAEIKVYLNKLRWPVGLQNLLIDGVKNVPSKFFVCDDSGSMMNIDGRRLVRTGDSYKLVTCSRWSEMTESLRFHINLASAASAPAEFRLLNGVDPITVGTSKAADVVSMEKLFHQLDIYVDSSSARTRIPLSFHVDRVAKRIAQLAPKLRSQGKKAALIILTDGQATDGDIIETMRCLKNLPVWVVIRLCTNDNNMTQYWNGVDSEVELNMDVIDDPLGEAKEIHKVNSWLTYGEPLHRLREFGVMAREMDLIDENTLSIDHMKAICCYILDKAPSDLPDPVSDWPGFLEQITALLETVPMVWNPLTEKMAKWVDVHKLNQMYGRRARCCTIN